MSENAAAAQSAPLSENQYVRELFSILLDNGRDTGGLSALLGHVSEMEAFVKNAEDKISAMKDQLAEMKEIQSHPVKTALQKAIKSLEHTVSVMKDRIGKLKSQIGGGGVQGERRSRPERHREVFQGQADGSGDRQQRHPRHRRVGRRH
jgi:chromosome segregation ATPase